MGETADGLKFEPQHYVAGGDRAVAVVSWDIRAKATGKSAHTDLALDFTLQNGKVTRFQAYFCLSACFRRPLYVAYVHAASGVPDQHPAVSAAVRRRGGVRAVPGGVPLAGRLSVSTLRPRPGLPAGRVAAAGMRSVSLPGVVDSGHRLPPDEDAADGVVLGRVSDDDRQARDLGAACCNTSWASVGMRRPGGSCTNSGEPWSTPPGTPCTGRSKSTTRGWVDHSRVCAGVGN